MGMQIYRYYPGGSVLGGAACGLSYEGALRDALAAEERERRQEAGHLRQMPAPQDRAPRRQPQRSMRRDPAR